uniref:Uncharacterized protein n=1 Tax=Timema genevievae TaxID=629358 RepID=A0A7R9K032_TIMGE|nr:unnamed protein product [Timema genevievae]
MAAKATLITLNNGKKMPVLGFGTWQKESRMNSFFPFTGQPDKTRLASLFVCQGYLQFHLLTR